MEEGRHRKGGKLVLKEQKYSNGITSFGSSETPAKQDTFNSVPLFDVIVTQWPPSLQ